MLQKIASGFALAFSMLSIIPFFKVHNFYKGINGYAVLFYPLVGFILGLLLWGVAVLLEGSVPAFHLGVILFGLWVLLTGALHLDGFADSVDGFFVSKERALEVMKDAHNGGMGMLFSTTFLLLKASSLVALGEYALLPFVLMFSRFGAVLQIYLYPYIGGGIAALAKEEFSKAMFFITLLYVVLFALFFETLWLFALGIVFVLFVSILLLRRYNGLSGDMYGFSIELVELLLLNALIIGAA
jgi:cobalamin synthase